MTCSCKTHVFEDSESLLLAMKNNEIEKGCSVLLDEGAKEETGYDYLLAYKRYCARIFMKQKR